MGPTLLITTLDRPDELRRCLASVIEQRVLPDEVVIVDGSSPPAPPPLQEELLAKGVRVVPLRRAPGRTAQLNMGIRAASGDPIIIVDDDVVLEPRFVGSMLEAFERGGPTLGAVQGTMQNDVFRPWPARALRSVFMQSRHTRESPGRMLRSGYYTLPVTPSRPVEVEVLRLTACAFRRDVLREFLLDESLHGYALKEDIDLSYRISRRYQVLAIPDARFWHIKTPASRIGIREKSAMHVVNNFWFYSKHLKGPIRNRLAFAWGMTGRLGSELFRTVANRNPDYALGALDGLREVFGRRRRHAHAEDDGVGPDGTNHM
ncbi:MAG: glycosyltransferase family 2 protein [Actinomycetota bacterium]|nr:glycosyltransferase family 2 protein [Actinomycetota bacterium]